MGKRIHSIDSLREIFNKHGLTLLSDSYKNIRQKLKVKCRCGSIYYTSLDNFNKSVQKKCHNCRTNPTKYTPEQVKQLFINKGYVPNFSEYKNNKTPLDCYCPCGEPMKVSLNDMLRYSYKCKKCWIEAHSGENNCNYNPKLTEEERVKERSKEWSRAIKKIDDYTCQICGTRGGNLNSHHLYNYANYPEHRTELKNGKTLCRKCHLALHKKYGFKQNEAFDYLRFKNGEDCFIFDFANPFSLKAYTPANLKKECEKYDVYNVDVKKIMANQKEEEKKKYSYSTLSTGYSKDYLNSINN